VSPKHTPKTATPELTVVPERFWCEACGRWRPASQMKEQVSKYEWQYLLECKECQSSKGHAHRPAVNVSRRLKQGGAR